MAAPSPGPPPSAFPTSALLPSPQSIASSVILPPWTREEDKLFEFALSMHDRDALEFWQKVSSMVPGKDSGEIQRHFAILVEDVKSIEADLVPLPNYNPSSSSVPQIGADEVLSACESAVFTKEVGFTPQASFLANGSINKGGDRFASKVILGKPSEQERRKGIPWTEDEHRLFLLGLEKYGKGDWRSISRNFVISRTPTQVASHAQKYFIRLASMNKDKKRTSIHDITSVSDVDVRQKTHHPPITGQEPTMDLPVLGQPVQLLPRQSPRAFGCYIPPAGKSVTGPTEPAVGTPVLLPSPSHTGPFGARPHSPKPVMSTPCTASQATYPMSQLATYQ